MIHSLIHLPIYLTNASLSMYQAGLSVLISDNSSWEGQCYKFITHQMWLYARVFFHQIYASSGTKENELLHISTLSRKMMLIYINHLINLCKTYDYTVPNFISSLSSYL